MIFSFDSVILKIETKTEPGAGSPLDYPSRIISKSLTTFVIIQLLTNLLNFYFNYSHFNILYEIELYYDYIMPIPVLLIMTKKNSGYWMV